MEVIGEALGEFVAEHRREIDVELKLVRGEIAEAKIAMCDRMITTLTQVQAALRGKVEPVEIASARPKLN